MIGVATAASHAELARRDDPEWGSAGWRVAGRGRIDDRAPVPCTLVINPDGSWAARIAVFTFAGQVDIFFVADAGGHFCGPAFVNRSGADSAPFNMYTELIGAGPLLIAHPADASAALPDAETVDAEVVDEPEVGSPPSAP